MQPVVLDLNELITGLSKMLRRLIGEDIALELNLDSVSDRIKADPGQINQVIMNLAVNARDAMPNGGTLRIETAVVRVDGDRNGSGRALPSGQYVMLRIADTGGGIDPAIRHLIFEPFFSTKPAGRGTGLGLATVYGIVTQAGGAIVVDSDHGEGATFTVYLPTTDEEASVLLTDGPAPAQGGSGVIFLSRMRKTSAKLPRGCCGKPVTLWFPFEARKKLSREAKVVCALTCSSPTSSCRI